MIIGIFRRHGQPARAGVKLGRNVLDVAAARAPHFDVLVQPSLNAFMSRGRSAWRELREWVEAQPPDHPELVPLAEVEVLLPAMIGDYTDFYASIHHATNVGSMFRPDQPLLPNYKWLPVGLSRSRVVDRPEWHAGAPSARADADWRCGSAVRPVQATRL